MSRPFASVNSFIVNVTTRVAAAARAAPDVKVVSVILDQGCYRFRVDDHPNRRDLDRRVRAALEPVLWDGWVGEYRVLAGPYFEFRHARIRAPGQVPRPPTGLRRATARCARETDAMLKMFDSTAKQLSARAALVDAALLHLPKKRLHRRKKKR